MDKCPLTGRFWPLCMQVPNGSSTESASTATNQIPQMGFSSTNGLPQSPKDPWYVDLSGSSVLDVGQRMRTSHHPQMDGHTEVMSRTLENSLRAFTWQILYKRDGSLILAELEMINAMNPFTSETPFYLKYIGSSLQLIFALIERQQKVPDDE